MKHFALMAAMLLCSLSMSAQVVQIDGIWYKLLEWYDHSAAVAVPQDGTKYSGAISIPSSVMYEGEEYRVDSIDSYVFQNCDGLTSVTILGNITGGLYDDVCYAFKDCNNLECVTLNCPTVGTWFSGMTSIKEIVLDENVTEVESAAFEGCTGLERVTMDCSNVGNWFQKNTAINEVVLGNNVKEFVAGAFGGCSGLAPLLWVRTWLR